MHNLSQEEMLELLKQSVAKEPSMRAWARKHNLSEAQLGSILKGCLKISNRYAHVLGYRARIVFEPFNGVSPDEN